MPYGEQLNVIAAIRTRPARSTKESAKSLVQVSRLRARLSSKSRNVFTDDFHYGSWIEKTNVLRAELENES
jgi:hypothetical protein